MPISVDFLGQAVAGCHFFDPLANVRVHHVKTTKQNWQQPFSKRLASGHPLVVAPPPVMVRPIELGVWDDAEQPLEKLLVSHMHPQGHLSLASIAAEMALANQNANQKTFFEVGHGLSSLQGGCFTVKFPVKHWVVSP